MDDARAECPRRTLRDAGGTSGGLGTFLLGAAMAVGGGYLLLNQVVVTSHFWRLFGYDLFGFSLVPLLLGIALLFYNGRSVPGWLLVVGGSIIIVAGVLANLTIFFRPTSLFNTLLMFTLLVGGLGLVARSLRPS
ncbi:MAG: hypothetical protein M3O34_09105 [Chloroflexota bacterium]|nr:hypothetical protein [Chloroflexota bacterium]